MARSKLFLTVTVNVKTNERKTTMKHIYMKHTYKWIHILKGREVEINTVKHSTTKSREYRIVDENGRAVAFDVHPSFATTFRMAEWKQL